MARNIYGIDFGTGNIKIFCGVNGKVRSEKSIIAVKDGKNVLAIGDEAYEMYEKTPDNIKVVFPIKYGVIADLSRMRMLFKKLTEEDNRIGRFCIAVPSDVTEVEKRAFYDVVAKSEVRAREIKMVEKPIADAVGLGIDMTSSRGNMIINAGADTVEISVISNGGIVLSRIIKMGGNFIDELICETVKKRYNVFIGMRTAEKIKIAMADAMYDEQNDENDDIIYIFGRNIITGLPSERGITKDCICDAIAPYFNTVADAVRDLMERTPKEILADINNTGIYLTGGSSVIANFDKLIEKRTDVKVRTVKVPEESVVRGLSRIVSDVSYKGLLYEPTESKFL